MAKSKLANVSLSELKAEVKRRLDAIDKLIKQRDELEKLLQQMDVPAGASAVKAKGPKRKASKGRARRGADSLAGILASVMKGKGAVKVAEATSLAVKAGYKSVSDNLAGIVSQTLAKDARFKKIKRGVFSVKG
jgi:hypothetical protein